jgi:hypothetical protein
MNTLMNLNSADLTQSNYGTANTQQTNNTRLSADTPKGILAGSVVGVASTTASGVVVAAKSDGITAYTPLGIAINNAVGYPFESSSGVGSGKCPYIHGSGTVFATDLYETVTPGNVALTYLAGQVLYASINGLLVNTVGATTTGDGVVGIVLIPPSSSDPFMVVQMKI